MPQARTLQPIKPLDIAILFLIKVLHFQVRYILFGNGVAAIEHDTAPACSEFDWLSNKRYLQMLRIFILIAALAAGGAAAYTRIRVAA